MKEALTSEKSTVKRFRRPKGGRGEKKELKIVSYRLFFPPRQVRAAYKIHNDG